MSNSNPIAFTGNPLDRADYLRGDDEILGDWFKKEDSKTVVFAGDTLLSNPIGDIEWLATSKLRFLPTKQAIFLGLDDGAPRYGVSLDGFASDFEDMFEDAKFRDVRGTAMKLASHGIDKITGSLGIVAQAKSMLAWHESHGFCAKCGTKTDIAKAGYERKCPACDASHFPRTDPVVIMLTVHEDKILMGRGPHFPPGFFSALAGFMEPGETIEEAAVRETYEEAGIRIKNVRYVKSQPWPWPSSLMIGCIADAVDTEIHINDGELEEVAWFTRDQIMAAKNEISADLMLPPSIAIARNLIEIWLQETA